jgi:ATP-binding protein involved in chromosome partitioning
MHPTPKEITRSGGHDIKLIWNDGHQSVFIARPLRLSCPCAACVEEMTGRAILRPETVPPDVHPTAIQLVGRYGIQISWSDGHSTGIYTFEQLRMLCPCPECAQQVN